MNNLEIRTRTAYLRGEEDTAGDDVINSHDEAAILDICNKYPFSWTNADDDLADGDNLPSDINRKWGITVTDTDGNEYTEILPSQQYSINSNYVYWVSGGKFYTNSSDTLKVFYYYIPTIDMTDDNEVCIVPDGEAVAYLAASKMFIGDERNKELKDDYEKEASDRIDSMWQADNLFGPQLTEGSILDFNPQVRS